MEAAAPRAAALLREDLRLVEQPPAPRTAPLQTVRQLATPELPLVVRPPTTITGARQVEQRTGFRGTRDIRRSSLAGRL